MEGRSRDRNHVLFVRFARLRCTSKTALRLKACEDVLRDWKRMSSVAALLPRPHLSSHSFAL